MKKIVTFLIAILFLPLAQATQFKEGTHYTVLDSQVTSKPVVEEFFSYYCPHCFKFEPTMAAVTELLSDNIKVERNHVAFIGREMGVEMQKAFATAELLNVEAQVSGSIFSALHDQKQHFSGREDIRNTFTDLGIDGKKFDGAVNSFAVNGMVARMDKKTRDRQIRGVPAVIVNGKYQINMGSLRASGAELNTKLAELIEFLAAKTE